MRNALALLAAVVLSAAACETPLLTEEPAVEEATLMLANESANSIYFVYISPCSASGWGSDRLGSDEVVASGRTRSWTLEPGCYDLKAVDSMGDAAEEMDVQLPAGGTLTWRITS